jgi:hypothetical protein
MEACTWRVRGLVVALAACVLVLPATQASAAATFANPAAITIPVSGTASPYPSPITVSGLAGTITDLNVTTYGFSHTFPEDVAIVVVDPGGNSLDLQDRVGDINPPGAVDVTTTFDDQASAALQEGVAWSSGSYKPTAAASGRSFPGLGTTYGHSAPAGAATLASIFNNADPNGSWSLYVGDFAPPDGGSIAGGWSLAITTSSPDVAAPHTTIQTGPTGAVSSASASFAFAADELASFECKLDSAAFAACASPASYGALADGAHTFSVRATDPSANVESIPPERTFTVDTTPPETTIDSGPAGTISASTATFVFSASEPAAFECTLDSAAFAACTSPQTYTGLADGQHTFQLRATDAAGNVDRTASSRMFTVADTGKPIATIAKPKPKRGKRTAKIEFSAIDDRTSIEAITFTCALDGGAAAACTSPATYGHLTFGKHTLTVVAMDLAGNESRPASTSFKIKRR